MVNKNKLFFVSALIVLILDIITKLIVSSTAPALKLLPFFSLVYIQNTGAGFGILKGQQIFLSLISIIALFLIYKYYKDIPKNKYVIASVGLISGGIIGNLIDRLFKGYVVDFLDFFVGVHHWPAFNIADSALVIGIAVLIIYSFKKNNN